MEYNDRRSDYQDKFHSREIKIDKGQSLKEKIGASAEEIRKAIEKIGFDRAKVEEYLLNSKQGN